MGADFTADSICAGDNRCRRSLKYFNCDLLGAQSSLAAWSFILTGLFAINRNIVVPSPAPPQEKF